MDVMRSAYRTKMRLFKDSDREDWVRWYPAPLPVKVFPGWHLFASQNWMRDKALEWSGPGEVKGAPRQFLTGRNVPFYLGDCHVGEDRWFQEGMPASALLRPIVDLPQCCALPLAFSGAAEAGDQFQFVSTPAPPAGPWLNIRFTVSGVLNNACSDCGNLNRTWHLSRPSISVNVFSGTEGLVVCGEHYTFQLNHPSLTEWRLNVLPGPFLFAIATGVTWDQQSPLVMTVSSVFDTACANVPLHVTIEQDV